MIHGIGTDIVRVARMQNDLEKFGARFADRILADGEQTEFARIDDAALQARFLAKRFAAKEAAAKALGTGFRDGLAFKHIAVTHDELGKPLLIWQGAATEITQRLGIGAAYLSIADEQEYAVAYVVLLRSV